MHSKDPAKQEGDLWEAFKESVESILVEAGESKANFRQFVFPRLSFHEGEYLAACDFSRAVFTQDAYFGKATFAQGADFSGATFTEDADFRDVSFAQKADFNGATFKQSVSFARAVFAGDGNFNHVTVVQESSFSDAVFSHAAYFSNAVFTQNTRFDSTKFKQNAAFAEAKFVGRADFMCANFLGLAIFVNAHFLQDAKFLGAEFRERAVFLDAVFRGAVDYSTASFAESAEWHGSQFLAEVEFRYTKFSSKVPAAFYLAKFWKPEEVVFDAVDLSHVSFYNCDVSRIWFTSSTSWARVGGRKAVLVEETMTSEEAPHLGLWRDGNRDHKAIAQIYQQLKKNYDDRLDYWTANEFHFGEMEMQRLDVPREGPLLGLRRWWHAKLSLVGLYRWGSNYGNSFQRPLWWLVAVLVLSSMLFPVIGLTHTVTLATGSQVWVETFSSGWQAGTTNRQKARNVTGVLGHGMLTALDTATFQRNIEYGPVYPWGRVLAITETLLTSTLVALFFLALRRQFRR